MQIVRRGVPESYCVPTGVAAHELEAVAAGQSSPSAWEKLATMKSSHLPEQKDDAAEYYLKPEVKLEPLMCRWSAWAHLIAPAPCAMNIAFRYLQLLNSFIANPSIHIAASKDPALLGGPFVSLKATDIPRIRRLVRDTTRLCADLVRFASDLKQFNEALQSTAKGYSLEHLYSTLPSSLAGLLELTYDLNNSPSFKLVEDYLYTQALETQQCQEICLHLTPAEERCFFMSTPLLEAADRVFIALPFASELLDALIAARLQPTSIHHLRNRLRIEEHQVLAFNNCFTDETPIRSTPEYADRDNVRVRYFGHACILLQTSEVSILIDPLTSWERDDAYATLTFYDLPDFIDFVVITHSHQDHCVSEFLIQLRRRIGQVLVPNNDVGNLADPSLRLVLRALGIDTVLTTTQFQRVAVPDGEIICLPFLGEHAGLNINSKQCVAIKLKGRSFVLLADSDVTGPHYYKRLAAQIGSIDTMFVGMECHGAPLTWLYGPLLTKSIGRKDDESRRLTASDAGKALNAVRALRCRRAFVYALGQEPWLKYLMGMQYAPDSVQIKESDKFVASCNQLGVTAERLMGCREMQF
jgi:L-ascorbate metabolism protein UlaG (beta-lactamase superfamily)